MNEKVCNLIAGIVLIAIIVLSVAVFVNGVMPEYSSGVRVGELVKASKKGLVFRSWESDLLLSEFAFRKGEGKGQNVWEFSSTDDAIGSKLEDLSGRRVRVHYKQWFIGPIWQSTSYTAIRVEVVE